MCSNSPEPRRRQSIARVLALVLMTSGFATAAPSTQPAEQTARVLRVSMDGNNLPFSNDKGEGFENKIAELIARELNAKLEYHWRAQRRGFFRESLKGNECDLVIGVPAGFDKAMPTHVYYRSTYAFVSHADRHLDALRSFDDPRLRDLKIGVQMVGDDGANTPPAHALAARGIVKNIVGYTLYGDYRETNPTERVMKAVAAGDVDVAVVWGPLAGYFATRESVPLVVSPVEAERDPNGLPFAFSIAMGVRKGDVALRDEVNGVLDRRGAEINAILDSFGVPRLPLPPTTQPVSAAEAR